MPKKTRMADVAPQNNPAPGNETSVTRRLAPEVRERQIVLKAVEHFATHGFSGSTRELARQLGVTQPLLYRYFPSKEALIDRVYDEVYQWDSSWEHLIKDDRDFAAHLEYIHFNPVRHGLVSAPRDWPHSTFRDWVARGAYDPTWGSDEAPELPEWAGHE